MRITNPGHVLHGYTGEWICPHCNFRWEMDATDPEPRQSSDQRDNGAFGMPCPNCHEEVWRHTKRSKDGPG